MDIRKIDRAFLQSFIGGVWYLKLPSFSFEKGDDRYHLFRSRILNIQARDDGELRVELEKLPRNLFKKGKWVEYETNGCKKVYQPRQITRNGKPKLMPDFTKISETVAFIEIDALTEVVLYAKEEEQPDVTNCFANFPKGFEAVVDSSETD